MILPKPEVLHVRQSDWLIVLSLHLCDKVITAAVRPQHLPVNSFIQIKRMSDLRLEFLHHTNAWNRKMQLNNDYYQLK